MSDCKSAEHKILPVLGVPVSVLNMNSALDTIARWIDEKSVHYVCAADVHSIMRAQDDTAHKFALRQADLVLPDGMPVTWIGKLRGEKAIERVCGPDLMLRVFERSAEKGWRHYFYGGAEGVADLLTRRAIERYPNLTVVGTDCPPFRPLSQAEIGEAIARINSAAPDIIWVGLGCPKQERWMLENVTKLNHAVLIGVGAAFDFHSGNVRRAPVWMRSSGLEWLHRLLCEPRRLWRRYLSLAPRFVFLNVVAAFEALRFRHPTEGAPQ